MGTDEEVLQPECVQEDLYPQLTYDIIGAAMEVHGKLGCGFLEKVYENALVVVLRRRGISVLQQVPIPVYFDNEIVGEYVADLLVEGKILLELKALRGILEEHRAQLINYLKATRTRVGLLLNFGSSRLLYERFVY